MPSHNLGTNSPEKRNIDVDTNLEVDDWLLFKIVNGDKMFETKKYFYYGYVSLLIPLRSATFTILHLIHCIQPQSDIYVFSSCKYVVSLGQCSWPWTYFDTPTLMSISVKLYIFDVANVDGVLSYDNIVIW